MPEPEDRACCWGMLSALMALFVPASPFLGRYAISPRDAGMTILTGVHPWACDLWNGWALMISNASIAVKADSPPHGAPTLFHTVIFGIRLPRILTAVLVGAGLSVPGTSFQGLFKNLLVSPKARLS